MRRSSLLALAVVLALAASATACLWDTDTLAQERARFPNTLELITGKFPRHSRAYYEWRIKDRLAKLEKTPNDVVLLDDLAVGYHKLGDHAKAIETMLRSDSIQSERYETLSNLGTFYLFAGDFDAATKHIEHALKINPDAHFGREKYQLLLVKYLVKVEFKEKGLPLWHPKSSAKSVELSSSEVEEDSLESPWGFAEFLIDERNKSWKDRRDTLFLSKKDLNAAVQGVEGMMRFADHDSPILLEALASLLSLGAEERETDAKQLAARALLKAAYPLEKSSADGDRGARYRRMAWQTLNEQIIFEDAPEKTKGILERDFLAELVDANQWFSEVEANERKWIDADSDVDAKFHEVYFSPTSPPLVSAASPAEQQSVALSTFTSPPTYSLTSEQAESEARGWWILVATLCGLGAVVLAIALVRRRSQPVAAKSDQTHASQHP